MSVPYVDPHVVRVAPHVGALVVRVALHVDSVDNVERILAYYVTNVIRMT